MNDDGRRKDSVVKQVDDLDATRQRRAKQLIADTDGARVKLVDELDDSAIRFLTRDTHGVSRDALDGYQMTTDYLQIEFVYPRGESQEVLDELEEALNGYDEIESSRLMIEPRTFGNTQIGTYDGITDHWPLGESEFSHESPQCSIDLADSPTTEFSVSEFQYLEGGAEHPLDAGPDEPLRELIDVLEFCYTATEERPVAVYSTTPDTLPDVRKPPITAESVANGQLTYLPWRAIFTPTMVEAYGRETLLSAPAWHAEELDDGPILLVCHNDVSDWNRDCRTVAEHVGLPSYRELG